MRNSMRRSPAHRHSRGHRPLHLNRAAHGVDDAGELDQQAVAGGLDDAAAMLGDLRVDQLAPDRLQPRERAFLVRAHQPRIADDIGRHDCRQTAFDPPFAHMEPVPQGNVQLTVRSNSA